MHLKKTFLWLGVTLLGCLVSTSSASPALDQYSALRAMRPDGRQIAIQDWKLNKDVFQFNFQQGLFHLMNDIDGRLVGAICIGDGDLRFSPDDPREIQNLRVMATDPEATGFGDSFTKIMLLFADDTAEQLLAAGEVTTASPNATATMSN